MAVRMIPQCLLAFSAFLLAGCGSSNWSVTAENRSPDPWNFEVTLRKDGGSVANVEKLATGQTVTMISGPVEQYVHTVTIWHGDDRKVFTPQVTLRPGQRFQVIVEPNGKLTAFAEE